MRCLLFCLLCLSLLAQAAEPELRIRTQLDPAGPVLVGGTVNLQVDVLTDTWFTSPPQLSSLNLAAAQVFPPSGSQHLNEQIDGKAFFGLRFTYQIVPQQAGSFAIPALQTQVEAGQASGSVTLISKPLEFAARYPEGVAPGGAYLVAQDVKFTQRIEFSHQPLRVGDSLVRILRLEAEGAQTMLIPPPNVAEVPGLKLYRTAPLITPLSDGRGNTYGGVREDRLTYVVGAAGTYQLPAISLPWWDSRSGEAHSLSIEAKDFQVQQAASYQQAFSITDDLRALGQKTQVRIARHWLLLSLALLFGFGLLTVWRLWGGHWFKVWKHTRQLRQEAWRKSPEYAWRQIRPQLEGQPPQLGALYLWIRRISGCREMSSYFRYRSSPYGKALLAFLRVCYGSERATGELQPPYTQLAALRQAAVQEAKAVSKEGGLRPLNPEN